ncbi:MAG: DUF4442 domain-containing protein [Bacteroidetes bacterium]|nr:DUF4442 domain-containing protein [Bacteroidota bacterium]
MNLRPLKFNWFLLFKLPSAYFSGVRLTHFDSKGATVRVRLNWFTKNPFKSMFWAIQGMAAELSTGVIVMDQIRKSGKPFSMLVTQNQATFLKKAKGTIEFSCDQQDLVAQSFAKALSTHEGVRFWMNATGKDASGTIVSEFKFEWSIKEKS